MVENLQLYLSLPRIIQIGLCLIICLIINRKFSITPFQQRPLVHRLFLLGLISWFVGSIIDFLVYPIAPLSFDPNVPIERIGYDFNYPSLVVANFLKDIVFITIYFMIWCFIYASFAIEKGELKAKQTMRQPWNYLIFIAIGLIIISLESVGIRIEDDTMIVGTVGDTFASFAKYLLPTFGFSFSAVKMSKTLKDASNQGMNEQEKLRTRLLTNGVSILAISYCFYIIMRIIGVVTGLYNYEPLYLLTAFILHSLWIVVLIFIFKGLSPENKKDSSKQ